MEDLSHMVRKDEGIENVVTTAMEFDQTLPLHILVLQGHPAVFLNY